MSSAKRKTADVRRLMKQHRGVTIPRRADGGSIPFDESARHGFTPMPTEAPSTDYRPNDMDRAFMAVGRGIENVGLDPSSLRIFNRTIGRGDRSPITEADFKPHELDQYRQIINRVGSPSGHADYAHYRNGEDSGAIGGFNFETDPGGQQTITDEYDFNTNRGYGMDDSHGLNLINFLFNQVGYGATLGRKVLPSHSGKSVPVRIKLPGVQPAKHANGGSVSEDDVWNGSNPIDDLRASVNTSTATPEQAAVNRSTLLQEILSGLPGPGNVLAAREAWDASGRGADALSRGEWGEAAGNYGNMGLNIVGAITGHPFSRQARQAAAGGSSRANTFVPVTQERATRIAKESQAAGEPPQKLYDHTGTFFAPDGTLRRSINDAPMTVNRPAVEKGKLLKVGDVVDHPKLFQNSPYLRDIFVRPTDKVSRTGLPISRTLEDGSLELSRKSMDLPADVAKLLQYKIGENSDFARAMSHDYAGAVRDMKQAHKMATEIGGEAAEAYARELQDQLIRTTVEAQELGIQKAGMQMSKRGAGNVDTFQVRDRMRTPASDYRYVPYLSYGKPEKGGGKPLAANTVVLPEKLTSHEQLAKFIERWHKHGAGRKFADGGGVADVGRKLRTKLKLVSGALTGATGGREDALPVKASPGSYVIPADIVSAIGGGNSIAGFKLLKSKFPSKPRRGGGVPIIVSDGEYVISPKDVASLGAGDLKRGHAVLDGFVQKRRGETIKHLSNIPAPRK